MTVHTHRDLECQSLIIFDNKIWPKMAEKVKTIKIPRKKSLIQIHSPLHKKGLRLLKTDVVNPILSKQNCKFTCVHTHLDLECRSLISFDPELRWCCESRACRQESCNIVCDNQRGRSTVTCSIARPYTVLHIIKMAV